MLNKIRNAKCLSNYYLKSLSNVLLIFNYDSDKIEILGLFRSTCVCVFACVHPCVCMCLCVCLCVQLPCIWHHEQSITLTF